MTVTPIVYGDGVHNWLESAGTIAAATGVAWLFFWVVIALLLNDYEMVTVSVNIEAVQVQSHSYLICDSCVSVLNNPVPNDLQSPPVVFVAKVWGFS